MKSDNSKPRDFKPRLYMNIEKDHEQRTIRGGVVLLV